MSRIKLFLALACLVAPAATAPAHAWGLGISIGLPIYPGPYYNPYPYYYRPYPYVYAPPVVVAQPQYVVQPTYVAPPASAVQPTVAPVPPSPTLGPVPSVVPASGVVQANNSQSALRTEQLLQQLQSPQENVRRDAALDLGRLKASKALDPLVRVLATDSSPVARDGAARALGLIGSAQSLTALIHAAQADTDRDVRHSAQFAVEVIRTNLRGNWGTPPAKPEGE